MNAILLRKPFFDLFLSQFPLCLSQDYVLNSDGTVTINNFGYNATGGVLETTLVGIAPDPNVGEFLIGPPGVPPSSTYQIIKLRGGFLGRDYRVILVYDCLVGPPGFPPLPSLFILSRNKRISKLQYLSLLRIAKDLGFDLNGAFQMVPNDQSDPICDQQN